MPKVLTRKEMEDIRNQVFNDHNWEVDEMDAVEVEILRKISEATMEKE